MYKQTKPAEKESIDKIVEPIIPIADIDNNKIIIIKIQADSGEYTFLECPYYVGINYLNFTDNGYKAKIVYEKDLTDEDKKNLTRNQS